MRRFNAASPEVTSRQPPPPSSRTCAIERISLISAHGFLTSCPDALQRENEPPFAARKPSAAKIDTACPERFPERQ